MTEAASTRPTAPIVVAVNATRRCGDTLEMAAALATSVGAELEVVFVEDADLMRLADLPVTREVDRLSGATRDLNGARMRRALNGETRRLRSELARIGKSTSVHSTLRVAHGQVFGEAMTASASVDVIFVHGTRRALPGERLPDTQTRRDMSASLRSPGRRTRGRKPVWTVYERGAAGVRTLRVASTLARTLASSLMVLIPCRGGDEAAAQKREAQAAVEQVDVQFLEVAENRSLRQRRLLIPGTGSLLVLPRGCAELEDDATRSYLESLGIPVVLVA